MGTKISGKYTGGLKVEMTHELSGTVLKTAAPPDNNGDGSSFSPTDLVVSALGSCIVTIMAIVAERNGIDFGDVTFSLEKHMRSDPRRIDSIPIKINMPAGLTDVQRQKLENASETCPVCRSLLPDIKKQVTFVYPETAKC